MLWHLLYVLGEITLLRADKNEKVVLTAALIDESTGNFVPGEVVHYDVRKAEDDSVLSPAIDGILTESTVKQGIYKTMLSIPDAGVYLCYTSCSGFLTATEDLIINTENIYSLVKQGRNYNISVEDVIRTSTIPTASQTSRKVPQGQTDFIITRIRNDEDNDWNSTTVSGVVYAHYRSTIDILPYRMGSEF